MNKYKAIFFDADDTLVNHKECEKQALMHLFNSIGENYNESYQDIFKPIDYMLWTAMSYEGISVLREDIPIYRFKLLFEKINICYDDYNNANGLFKVGLANSNALMENAVEIVDYLYNKCYMLCVVTNGLVELQKPRVLDSKIGKFISNIIVSEEVGTHKPNPIIFTTLLDRISLNASEVIIVGDSLQNDIYGAKNANIKGIWYNHNRIKNETDIIPDYEINNLLQIKSIV